MLISFVIPTKNSGRTIRKCLDSIFSQGCDVKFEVIIVDKNSIDNTLMIAEDCDVKIISCSGTVGEARKIGVEAAKGKWIAFVDSDVYIDKDWLEQLLEKVDDRHGAVGRVQFKRNLLGDYLSLGYPLSNEKPTEFRNPVPTLNVIIGKKAILEAGNFDDKLVSSEDGDMTYRMIKRNYSFFYVPSAKCFHDIKLSFGSVIKNDIWLMKGFLACAYKHGIRTVFFKEVLAAMISILTMIIFSLLLVLKPVIFFYSFIAGLLLIFVYSSIRYMKDGRKAWFSYPPGFILKRVSTALALVLGVPYLLKFMWTTFIS